MSMFQTIVDEAAGLPCYLDEAIRLIESGALQWRHHGIGVLQAYIAEGADPEVRLHVWDQRLVKPGISETGDVHDHRFDLVSVVLAGEVGHEEWVMAEAEDGPYRMSSVVHARLAAETRYHGTVTEHEGRYKAYKARHLLPAGLMYRFPLGAFHRSFVPGGTTVTRCEKHNQREDIQARVVFRADTPQVHAFGHDEDWDLISAVLSDALVALRGSAWVR